MIVYNSITGEWVDSVQCRKAVVGIAHSIITFGYISHHIHTKIVAVEGKTYSSYLDDEEFDKYFIYSEFKGIYILKNQYEDVDKIPGNGGFPYTFDRQYEALYNLNLFEGKQKITNSKDFWVEKYIKDYTFGLEFETSSGYIPQEKCFETGLIPLRDGSINGLEYTSVVLSGKNGLNLLYDELEQLRKHCTTDKECSLHIHVGGFPVNSTYLWILYKVLLCFEKKIKRFLPKWTFETRRYKNTRKDYCKKLWKGLTDFRQLYLAVANAPYFGDLHQNHVMDVDRQHKWQIHSRYYWVNFVNMFCYRNPKTIEFRFLRPSFNDKKIIYWLTLLISLLEYTKGLIEREHINAETIDEYLSHNFTLTKFINKQFDKVDSKKMKEFLLNLHEGVIKQTEVGDYYGDRVDLENYSGLTL